MLIVAHRGGNPDDVENSARAFAHGVDAGSDLLECDLQCSASGEIVVYHNTRYFGAPIRDFSTDELRGLIPTLLTFDELLEFLGGIDPNVRLVLDLKTRGVDRMLAPYLKRNSLRRRVLVTSTYAFGLWRLKRRFPKLRTGLSRGSLFSHVPARLQRQAARTAGRLTALGMIAEMTAFGIGSAVLNHLIVDERTVELFHARGLRVYVWTVDSRSRACQLHALGVDYLTTNVPAVIAPMFQEPNQGLPPEWPATLHE